MKILQISYYPIIPPITGGQRRIYNLRLILQNLGHCVHTIAVSPKRDDVGPEDISLSASQTDWVFRIPYDFEMRLSKALELNEFLYARLKRAAENPSIDIIWLEHPFLWSALRTMNLKVPIVYSSHNIEWMLKNDLLHKQVICDPHCITTIRQTEEHLTRSARFVVCCSKSDASFLKKYNNHCVLIPNGADTPVVGNVHSTLEYARKTDNLIFKIPTFTFVSSYHEANWFGLHDLVINSLNKTPPQSPICIVLIGGVSLFYKEWKKHNSLPKNVSIIPIPNAHDDLKNMILLNSEAILLPITHGGGTNLKTAEAILSGTRVIATQIAFRGFESFLSYEAISVADDYYDFAHHVIQIAQRRNRSSSSMIKTSNNTPNDQVLHSITWQGISKAVSTSVNKALESSMAVK